ncbi:hypothetical protein QBC42DRAFT_311614 [Cladorrhinum samala]|uniref:Mid2 domain-containing protein n=1 Tax=Cladorrhinum samala TaxID=585594 RepID=A0AAV9HG46_9PEZI|nr:hypothetical protein QBC42DRAFT_311614 [Cladorrhinum samala]
MKKIPTALLFLAFIPRVISLQCYHVSGNIVKDTNVVPCDPSATGKTGSHTSCCNKGTGDQCTSTGLCLATNAKKPDDLFWINGCTDPTWRDPACPQYCNPPVNPTTSTANPRLKICGNGTRYCCSNYYANDTECCENSFTLNRGVGVLVAHLTDGVNVPDDSDSATATASSALGGPSSTSSPPASSNEAAAGSISTSRPASDKSSTATAVTGGVLGTALLAVCAAAVLLLLQNRRLKTDLEAKRAELEERNNQQQRLLPGGDGASYKVYDAHDRSAEMYGQGISGMTVVRAPAYTYTSELPTSEGRVGQLP